MRRLTTTFVLIAISSSAAALGTTPPTDFLRGPDVNDAAPAPSSDGPMTGAAKRPTLVERSFDGTVRPLDERPETAAVRLLGLSAEQLVAIDELLETRALEIDRIVRDNLVLIAEAQTVYSLVGDDARRQKRDHLRELAQAFGSVLRNGPLKDQIAARLDDPARSEYVAILDEYDAATGATDDPPRSRVIRTRLGRLGLEIKASYQRTFAADLQQLEDWLVRLEIDDSTRERIRDVFRDLGDDGARPTQAQRRSAVTEAMRLLPPNVRRDAITELLNGRQ